MGNLTIEEKAFEMFPDKMFDKEFQEKLAFFYHRIIDKIAFIDMPVFLPSGNAEKSNLLYKCKIFAERDKFEMKFIEPKKYFYGMIEIDPNSEESPFCDELKKRNGIYMPPELLVSNPKFFKREISFVDLRHQVAILNHLRCDPLVLFEASKRFPSKGMIIIENNDIIKNPTVTKPSSDRFLKLQKLIGKMDKMLSDYSDIIQCKQ